jgi:hypothetical protein
MENIEEHFHAFVDAEGKIFNILVFNGHDEELLNTAKDFLSAHTVICEYDNPKAAIGGLLFNGKIYPPKPFASWLMDETIADWIPPVPEPEQGYQRFYWNEDSLSWKEIEQAPVEE